MKFIEYLFRGIGIIASLSLFLLGLALTVYAIGEGIDVVTDMIASPGAESKIIYKTMSTVDLILLAFSVYIASIGIYELFVKPISYLPAWIQVDDLDALKGMLIKVAIVVMGISFLGRVVTWDGETNLLNYGIAVAAVILALSYFIQVKFKSE